MVAGVGRLGRSIALVAAAREGADVVLAARTAERLDEVAKEVDGLGRARRCRRPHRPVRRGGPGAPGDGGRETGSAGSTRWSTTRWRCRRSRPSVPSRLEALSASFDGNVVLRAAADQAVHAPAGRRSKGAVVMNSMVVRFSQLRDGAAKLTKAALLAMAQSLATEFGPRGIRVNSVAPGHIWGTLAAVVLRLPGAQARGRASGHLRRDRQHRPAPAAGARRDRGRGGLPGLPAGPGDHRAVPGRQLRRVPPLSDLAAPRNCGIWRPRPPGSRTSGPMTSATGLLSCWDSDTLEPA